MKNLIFTNNDNTNKLWSGDVSMLLPAGIDTQTKINEFVASNLPAGTEFKVDYRSRFNGQDKIK